MSQFDICGSQNRWTIKCEIQGNCFVQTRYLNRCPLPISPRFRLRPPRLNPSAISDRVRELTFQCTVYLNLEFLIRERDNPMGVMRNRRPEPHTVSAGQRKSNTIAVVFDDGAFAAICRSQPRSLIHKKAGTSPALFYLRIQPYASAPSRDSSTSSGSSRSTSSTIAIGALSPARRPHFNIRR